LCVVRAHGSGTAGEFGAVTRVAARPARDILGEHPSLQCGHVTDQVAEAEAALARAPLHRVVRDAVDNARSALSDAVVPGEEAGCGGDLHAASVRGPAAAGNALRGT